MRRSVAYPDGRREEASGAGRVYWDTLEAVLDGSGGEPLRITYRFELDGGVRGRHAGDTGRAERGRRTTPTGPR